MRDENAHVRFGSESNQFRWTEFRTSSGRKVREERIHRVVQRL